MKICKRLEIILKHEESRNNNIHDVSEGWSKINFVINMEKSIDITFAQYVIGNDIRLRIWENNDNHYPIQIGITCDECKQSIAGPKK